MKEHRNHLSKILLLSSYLFHIILFLLLLFFFKHLNIHKVKRKTRIIALFLYKVVNSKTRDQALKVVMASEKKNGQKRAKEGEKMSLWRE